MINNIVENFSKPEFSYDLTIAVVAVSITAALAFFTWLLKISYENFIRELKLLKKIEIYLIRDTSSLIENSEYLEDWIECLKNDRPYTCAFRSYSSDNIDIIDITSLELLNKLNSVMLGLAGLEKDLNNTFNNYTKLTEKFLDGDHVKEWSTLNRNMLTQLSDFQKNFTYAQVDLEDSLAYLRSYAKQHMFSVFRVLKLLNKPIFPFISHKSVQRELKIIKRSLEKG